GNPVAGIDFVWEDFQLFDQDRRLDRIEPRRKADADVVIFVAPLPVHAQAAEGVGKALVVCHHGTAVAIAAERFGGKKTGGRRLAERAQAAVVAGCAKTLSCIVEDQKVFSPRRGLDSAMIRRQPEQIHWNNRLWLETGFLCSCYRAGNSFGV